jgi:DNA-binding MarR family transcriptional regulator
MVNGAAVSSVSSVISQARMEAQGAKAILWQRLLQIDDYILDTLMVDLIGHDRQPSAFLVYLFLWRRTHGQCAATVQIALQDIAEQTGLSKRSVQSAIAWLAKRKLVAVARDSITAIPVYTVMRPWLRL